MASVLIPIAQGCEELEAVTLIDLLRRADIEVITAGLTDEPVCCSRGTVIIADDTLANLEDRIFDMIILPGGLPGADYLNADARIHSFLKKIYANNGYCAAICAAPKVLATAGLLKGRNVTSFPGVLEAFPGDYAELKTDPVVEDGRIITSRGPGTAMDFALVLIEKLVGLDIRRQVESGLQRPV
ncbi:MAG: DJ-1 family glyoxalase III [Gammaproteobacteria bacterium]